jgi:hypothetical protein
VRPRSFRAVVSQLLGVLDYALADCDRSVKQPGNIVPLCLPPLDGLPKPIVDNVPVFAVVDK